MHDIEHDGIDNHESAVEDVKEGFVRADVAVDALEYFNHTVYITYQDQCRGSIQQKKHGPKAWGDDVFGLEAPSVEGDFQTDKTDETEQLHQNGGAELVAAGSKSGGTVAWVGGYGRTIGGKGADYGVEADEGGYYAPWVHGRQVGYIVEEAAQEDVVGEGVYWSGGFF